MIYLQDTFNSLVAILLVIYQRAILVHGLYHSVFIKEHCNFICHIEKKTT